MWFALKPVLSPRTHTAYILRLFTSFVRMSTVITFVAPFLCLAIAASRIGSDIPEAWNVHSLKDCRTAVPVEYIYRCICLPVHQSIHPSIHPHIHPSLSLGVWESSLSSSFCGVCISTLTRSHEHGKLALANRALPILTSVVPYAYSCSVDA